LCFASFFDHDWWQFDAIGMVADSQGVLAGGKPQQTFVVKGPHPMSVDEQFHACARGAETQATIVGKELSDEWRYKRQWICTEHCGGFSSPRDTQGRSSGVGQGDV
jgi:hypothetical protein